MSRAMGAGWKEIWEDVRRSFSGAPTASEPAENSGPMDGGGAAVRPDTEPPSGPETGPPARPRPRPHRWWLFAAALAAGAAALTVSWFRGREPRPPAPGVVATYDGGQITVEDVREHLAFLVPDKEARGAVRTAEDYRHLAYEMIGDELVKRWASKRGAEKETDYRHVMKHLTEEVDLDQAATKFHAGDMGVTEADLKAYYEANRERYGDQTLSEARNEIRQTLRAGKERQSEEQYIEGLKQKAVVTREFSLLELPEPGAQEIEAYYRTNAATYVVPARALVDEILFPVEDDEATAQQKAKRAQLRLRSGADFAALASEVSGAALPKEGTAVDKGIRGADYDKAVFALEPGQVSEVVRNGEAFCLVRLRSREPERQRSLDEARGQVREALLVRKEEPWFREREARTLLTIDGKPFTVGQFWEEYKELPETFRSRFLGQEGRRALAERLIERWLVLQDSRREASTPDVQKELGHRRLEVLSQMLEQEEVDDKIVVTDDEVRAFFEKHKEELAGPPRSQVRYIALRLGETGDDQTRTRKRAEEAYRKLVSGLWRKGADFVQVARQYSEDPATAQTPVWVGEGPDVLAEVTQHPLHEYIQGIEEGKVGKPVEWDGYVYILQVLDRKAPRLPSFEQAKGHVREILTGKKHQERRRTLNDDLMTRAHVKVYESTLRTLASGDTRASKP